MARTKGSKAAGTTTNAYDKHVKELEDKVAMYEAKEMAGGDEELNISQTEYIRIMSMLPYKLNLCTKERGQGNVYKFEKLFQIKRIIYSDLVQILEVNRSFLEKGKFLILNEKVIRANGLDDVVAGILTKDKIEEILEGTNESIALYTSAGDEQKKVILEMIVNKLMEDPNSIDLNVVDKLSRLCKLDLLQKANDNYLAFHPQEEEKE